MSLGDNGIIARIIRSPRSKNPQKRYEICQSNPKIASEIHCRESLPRQIPQVYSISLATISGFSYNDVHNHTAGRPYSTFCWLRLEVGAGVASPDFQNINERPVKRNKKQVFV